LNIERLPAGSADAPLRAIGWLMWRTLVVPAAPLSRFTGGLPMALT